jgi:addiction module RelE/StbE family toxin
MEIVYRKKFKKTFKKQSQKIHNKFFERLEVFKDDPFHYSLNNHALGGEFKGIRSFDITGDIRVHYTETDGVAVFLMIGSHSELY